MFSLLEYIKIHRISLEQDWQALNAEDEPIENYHEMRDITIQLKTLDHLIRVAKEVE